MKTSTTNNGSTTAGSSPADFPSAELRLSPRGSPRATISGRSLFAMHALNATVEHPGGIPSNATRADIVVDVQVSLERPEDKDRAHRAELAHKVKETTERKLKQWYTGVEGQATYRLKVYVVLAREGSALNALTLGKVGDATEECLEWFLQSSDGSTTYKAGRVGDKERWLFTNREHELTDRVPLKLAQEIVDQVNIKNRSASLKHQV